ncbi:MAG: TonB-dependent receptor, partial [Bacteroidetes bacterium]|nr:TonB-dependent receptor [Bacteroidota bacterium]
GALFTGLAGHWANRQWYTDVRVYNRSAENDFPYTNTLSTAQRREENTHSAFWQRGVVAQLGFKPAINKEWWLQSWWNNGWRQIQGPLGSAAGSDEQEDSALRLNLQYKHVLPHGELRSQGGWLADEMRYNGASFQTRQFIFKTDWEHDLSQRLRIQLGGQWNWRQASNDNYKADENRLEASARLRWQPMQQWVGSINLHQVATDTLLGPLVPSIGSELRPFRHLQIKTAAGRHYRLPTLHDRFWPIFGQPDLKPEKGWHAEGNLLTDDWIVLSGRLQLGLTRYWLWINDWIMWRPTVAPGSDGAPVSGWGPKNLREVYSRGWEADVRWQHKVLEFGANAAYTRSENRNALDEFDRTYRQQLPFVPVWKGGAWFRLATQGWLGELNGQYTGRRYTTGVADRYLSLPPYYLLNLSAGKSLLIRKMQLSLLLQVRNLLDHQYQNYENRAMPGRSYNLTINYTFTTSEK